MLWKRPARQHRVARDRFVERLRLPFERLRDVALNCRDGNGRVRKRASGPREPSYEEGERRRRKARDERPPCRPANRKCCIRRYGAQHERHAVGAGVRGEDLQRCIGLRISQLCKRRSDYADRAQPLRRREGRGDAERRDGAAAACGHDGQRAPATPKARASSAAPATTAAYASGPTSDLMVVLHHQKEIVKKISPANQPRPKQRFQDAPYHVQNSAAAPRGASQAAPALGNASAKAIAATVAIASRARIEESMLRRSGFVVSLGALIVSACGRQVTPDRAGQNGGSGLTPGFMSVKFRTNGQFNFSQYAYLVVFDTIGDGQTPRSNTLQTNWAGYSIGLVVTAVGSNVQATAYQYYRPPGAPPTQQPSLLPLPTTPQQLVFIPNSNGQNTEFTIQFALSIANGYGGATPSASPSASPTASPSPTPTATASGATPTPSPTPINAFSTNWTFNYFVAQPSNGNFQPVDSLGLGGGSDTSFSSPVLDITSVFDTTFYGTPGGTHPTDPSAQIFGGEIANNP